MTSPSHHRPDRTRRRRTRAARGARGGLALTARLAGGCSRDDDAPASDETTTTAHDAGHDNGSDSGGDTPKGAPLEGDAMSAESCDHFATISASMVSGDPTSAADALEQFPATLPIDLQPQGSSVVEAFSAAFEGDPEAMSSREFELAFDSVGSAMWAGCEAASRIDVKGVDYGFEGLPAEVPAGTTALRFTNGSASEPHELIVVQRPDGDTTPVEDIAKMSPDELMADFPMVGLVFVESPDTSATSFIDLPKGSYVAICTIPVGGAETGDPHAAHGMIAELEAV